MTAYHVSMPLRFLLLSFALGVLASYYLGRAARGWLLSQQSVQSQRGTLNLVIDHSSLPPPVLGAADKLPPSTRYSTKLFEAKGTGSESFLVRSSARTMNAASSSGPKFTKPSLTTFSKSALKLPVSTEAQVVDLLNRLVAGSSDTILSYHCHHSQSSISCVGIAAHGHIALHTLQDSVALNVVGISLGVESTTDILGQPLSALQETKTSEAEKPFRSSKADRLTSAFVHPVLFVHDKPESVLLVGGSHATVQQILLHNNVKQLVVLDMDTKDDTILDKRVEVSRQTSAEWFAQETNVTMDVVLIASASKTTYDMATDVSRVLKDDGLLLLQAEQADTSSKFLWVEELKDEDEYDIIKEYSHGDTNFLMAMTDEAYLGQWFANEAEVNLKIHQRVSSPLPHFDGTIMQSYQYPNRIVEDQFCEDHPEVATCKQGHGFDPSRTLVPLSSFEVKLSTVQNAGRGVYLTHDAEEGAYIFVDGCVHNIHIPDSTVNIIDDFLEGVYKFAPVPQWETLMWYTHGYGFVHEEFGQQAHDVDPGIGTFVNHGCNGTTNVGSVAYINLTEFSTTYTVDTDQRGIYNPAFDRAIRTNACGESIALRRIESGEEIFNNYMTFENFHELEEYAESLRNECAGRAVGQISEYELSHQGDPILPPNLALESH